MSQNVVFFQAIISTRPCERPKGAWQSRLFFWWLTSCILRSRRAPACHFLSPIQIILVFLKGKTTTIRRDESLPRATFKLCDVTSYYEEVFYPQCRNSESFFKRKMKKTLIPIKRLFLIGDLIYSLRIFTLVKTIQ